MTNKNNNDEIERKSSLFESIFVIAVLVFCICAVVYLFPSNPTGGPMQLALIFTAFIAMLIGFKNGVTWTKMENEIKHSVGISTTAIFILFCVGALIGTWMLSGTVPSMIFYGLHFISPGIFYPSAALLCAFVSLSIGSSWTTIASVGIALVGIASLLGLAIPVTVGAIVSGAYFGDKMSPLSDTTNLAPAVADSDLFEHIHHMTWVSVPSFIIALILYFLIGLFSTKETDIIVDLEGFTHALQQQFNIGVYLLIPLFILLYMAYKRIPALPTIFCGALIGAVFAVLFQSEVILGFADNTTQHSILVYSKVIIEVMFSGFTIQSGNEVIDKLLSRGGMWSMAHTIWLILSAMLMAGVLSSIGVFTTISEALVDITKKTGSLIAMTLANSFIMNLIAGEQYISIVVPGQIWRNVYKARRLATVNLSRCLEDAGTLTSALVPWSTCGAYIFGVLGLSSFAYIPFCFFNIINPFISALYGFLGFTIINEDELQTSSA